jgi:hypothetical protein
MRLERNVRYVISFRIIFSKVYCVRLFLYRYCLASSNGDKSSIVSQLFLFKYRYSTVYGEKKLTQEHLVNLFPPLQYGTGTGTGTYYRSKTIMSLTTGPLPFYSDFLQHTCKIGLAQ